LRSFASASYDSKNLVQAWAQVDESDPKKNTVQHKTDSRIEAWLYHESPQ
jgi:hypothetical protein